MANQHAQRNWKQEMANTAARLEMCVFVPQHLTANTKVRCSCPHGVVKETTIIRFVERQFCCKSQASKAHDPEKKRNAANTRWSSPFAKNPSQTPEANLKRSRTLTQTIKDKKEEGWSNPGWGRKLSESERLLPGTLYLVRYLDESGTHFKIGITKLTLAERFSKGQLISIIHLHHATLGECFDLEQKLLKWAKDSGYRYSSSTTTELIHPAAIPLLLKNDSFNSFITPEGVV
jgi:hypothetical protein